MLPTSPHARWQRDTYKALVALTNNPTGTKIPEPISLLPHGRRPVRGVPGSPGVTESSIQGGSGM